MGAWRTVHFAICLESSVFLVSCLKRKFIDAGIAPMSLVGSCRICLQLSKKTTTAVDTMSRETIVKCIINETES